MDKLSLEKNLEFRNKEIDDYESNIVNFTRAIAKIDSNYPDDEAMAAFKVELEGRLKEEIIQQKRAIIIRDVIADQLQEISQPLPLQ